MHLDKAPDAFRTISEVADDLDIPQHVLRFWETRFAQIKPMKRSGGRRYYRPDDVDLLRGIRRLLYGEGYTIRGVQRILKEQGIKAVQGLANGGARLTAPDPRDVDHAAEFDDAAAPEADVEREEAAEEHVTAAVLVRREPALGPARASSLGPALGPTLGPALGSPLGPPAAAVRREPTLGPLHGPAARERELARREPELGPPLGPALPRHAEDVRPAAQPAASARRELDLARLETALQDLVTCKQMLDNAFEDNSSSPPL
ncbi:DNA-binding transcriptional MerR regulator [Rhodopseudomonas rhenobacensis]|uniref:DNA-binding transcriptional MerR regulator n=1 Tax=Rhodopseudomonas rhenobacensis TaxID=87461 RepID=A0A7W7Z0M8_9BRAD|nr:DNA-binding transcriptional MerR regulator [Rhodopseudomonas rhenobacensis]